MQPNHLKLFAEITSTVAEYIEPLYAVSFEEVNDALFELAEQAANNKAQSEVFDGMREIRSNRQLLEENFNKAIKSNTDTFSGNAKFEQKPLDILVPESSEGELSLVDLKDLDEKIAYGTIIQKANDQYFHALFELNQRLSILNHGYKLDDHSNPFGPARLTQVFSDISADLDLPQIHKDLLLESFGHSVLENLESLYAQCNAMLIDAGVLPDLKFDIRKRKNSGAPENTSEQINSDHTEHQAVAEPFVESTAPVNQATQHPNSAPQLYHSIQEIMSARPIADSSWSTQPSISPSIPAAGNTVQNTAPKQQPASQQPGSAPVNVFGSGVPAFAQNQPGALAAAQPGPAVQYYNNDQLVNVISAMQQQQLPEQLVFDPQHIENTKRQFIQQLRESNDPAKPHEIDGLDADTIDLIGMLFEFMLNDQDLCPSVKALLSHLHTPFLKVALLDKDFFTQHNHPARLLLNSMAKAGGRWVEENDKDRGVFPKMKSVVDRVLLEFEINLELFTELNLDFEKFVHQIEKRAEIAEKRASESIKGKDKLRLARDQAIQEINRRSQKLPPPECVDQFLRQCWLDILVFTLLRKGEDHPLWAEQKTLIEQLIWSTTPKHSEQELQQVRNKIEDINQVIARGFEQLGGYPGNSKALLREISAQQKELLNNPPTQKQASPKASTLTPETETETETVSTQAADTRKKATKPAEQKYSPELLAAIKQLRGIPFGTWFQFTTNAQGDTIKGKLSWYSPATSRYMFVNVQGKQIAVRSMLSLANSMRLGDALVIEEKKKPMVDRAMLAIYELIQVGKPVT